MRYFDITTDEIDAAKARAADMGAIRNSIREGAGNVYGFLGEILVMRCLPGSVLTNTRDNDILYKGRTIDVKTKCTTVVPRQNYAAAVPLLQKDQKCDMYVFARVLNNMSGGWVLGYLRKEEFMDLSKVRLKGEVEPGNDWPCTMDCYSLHVSELRDIERLL